MSKNHVMHQHCGSIGTRKSVTVCGHLVSPQNATTQLNNVTCKVCLNHVSKPAKRMLCRGCNDDFYNGQNPLGVKECWHFKQAKVIRKKKVGINDVPPWKTQRVVVVLSCRRERGFVFVNPEAEYYHVHKDDSHKPHSVHH